jgi:hypothetical protein
MSLYPGLDFEGKKIIQENYIHNILAITGQLMLNPSSLNIATFNHSCEKEQKSRWGGWVIWDFLVMVSSSCRAMRLMEQTKSRDFWNGDSGARHPAHQIQLQRFTLSTHRWLSLHAPSLSAVFHYLQQPVVFVITHPNSKFRFINYDFSYHVNSFAFNLLVK